MKKQRLLYLDNIRAALMILVILQHAVRAYGTSVWWFVSDDSAPLLERFTAVNSSFFMSLFFFLSFYFMPAAYDRKSFWAFHRDRGLRLLVPLVAYVLIVSSTMMYAYFRLARGYGEISFFRYIIDYFLGFGGRPADWSGPSWPDANLGPLWFVQHLIMYGIVYSLARLLFPRADNPGRGERPFPSFRAIAAVGAGLALASFAIRIRYPLYKWIGVLGFIQAEPAHAPFYLAMFFAGIAAYRNDWLASLPGRDGKLWFRVGAVSAIAVALFPVTPETFGGGTPLSLAYAACETFCCLGLLIGLPYWAWRRWYSQGPVVKALADNSYAMFILHIPFVVAAQFAIAGIDANPYLKFTLVSAISVPATFLASAALRKIPGIAKYV